MFNAIRTAALSAFVGLGALAAVPAAAHADGVYLNFGHGDPRFGIYAGDREHARDWRRDDWRRARDWRRSCSTERALDKAERMGLRRARVVDMSRHTIKVAGRKYNDRVVVVFGRERGCPILYR
jgi:ketosteroid isomerase-like protein